MYHNEANEELLKNLGQPTIYEIKAKKTTHRLSKLWRIFSIFAIEMFAKNTLSLLSCSFSV